MKMSKLFSQTLREAPSDADVLSQKLLLRAGFIRQLGAGIYSLLPLGKRSVTKLENIMREEMDKIGGQEITMPVVHPSELWKETGRWYKIGAEMGRFKDKNQRDMALAMTHEEVVADLTRNEIQSYRQLPVLVYHLQTKWRDDPRPRAGLIRVREFTMKDSYSLDSDWEGLDKQYRAHYQAYFDIFHRVGLDVIAVKSDVGIMGGTLAHEFMYLTPIGEDTLLISDECGYTANRQIAEFTKDTPESEDMLPLEKVATPDTATIADLANFLDIPKSRTAKAVFMMATVLEGEEDVEKFIFAVLRGDMELNETKLANAVSSKSLRAATDEEIVAIGGVPGYASPMGVKGAVIVVDDLIPVSPNLVAGANEAGFHYKNVNYSRDYTADIVTDIATANEGARCPKCGNPMRTSRGVEVGNIFKLGTWFSEALGATFTDQNSEEQPVIMGSYGIGVGRLLACIAEQSNDDYGLIWPITAAPYQVYIVSLKDADYAASLLYEQLQDAGIEVLYDDRNESAGVKFNDADLIGIPIRITVGKRGLTRGGVEMRRRGERENKFVAIDEVVETVQVKIAELEAEIKAKIVRMPYPEEDEE